MDLDGCKLDPLPITLLNGFLTFYLAIMSAVINVSKSLIKSFFKQSIKSAGVIVSKLVINGIWLCSVLLPGVKWSNDPLEGSPNELKS